MAKMTPAAHEAAVRRIRQARDTQAEFLDLGDFPISELPAELGTLVHLKHLSLGREKMLMDENIIRFERDWDRPYQQFTSLEILPQLIHLTTLKLSECILLSDLSPLQYCTQLTELDLSFCSSLSDLSPLQHCTQLTKLKLFHCQEISDLSPLQHCTQLAELYLSSCSLLSDLSPLQHCTQLNQLDLGYCEGISLKNNLLWIKRLETLYLFGGWFTDFPQELCGEEAHENVLPAVLAYFQDITTEAAPDTEVKVYLLGNGRVGKTKLGRRLRGLDYGAEHEITTHGVRLYDLTLSELGSQSVRLNLWDFGGQDIYHSSHTLFLREPAVYLLLWHHDHENDQHYTENGVPLRNRRLPYWFDYLCEQAGNGSCVQSPVLLIQSQCDTDAQKQPPPTELPDRNRFPKLAIMQVSAQTGYQLAEVQAELEDAIRYLLRKFPKPPLGPGWIKVREQIRQMQDQEPPQRTLSREQFEQLCVEAGGVSNPEVLLTFFHQSGVVFYRPGLFQDQIILDQQWALDAIYTIFDRESTAPLLLNDGRFTQHLLARLVWQKFTESEQAVFLGMMESCSICFRSKQLNPGEHPKVYEYIAPELLPDFASKQPLLQSKLATPTDATATVRFKFLHDGIVRSFLAKIGQSAADNAIYWKYGFWFRADESEVIVQVQWDNPASSSLAGAIDVFAWGQNADKLVDAVLKSLSEVKTGTPPEIKRSGRQPHFRTDSGLEASATEVQGVERLKSSRQPGGSADFHFLRLGRQKRRGPTARTTRK